MTFFSLAGSFPFEFWAINFGVVIPLTLSCLVLVAVIPSAASRGKLNVPVYALMMFAAAFFAFGTGRLAGAQSVQGTTLGIVVSFIFFLLVATAVGCFFGMFFYRQPSEESSTSGEKKDMSSAVPALDEDRR